MLRLFPTVKGMLIRNIEQFSFPPPKHPWREWCSIERLEHHFNKTAMIARQRQLSYGHSLHWDQWNSMEEVSRSWGSCLGGLCRKKSHGNWILTLCGNPSLSKKERRINLYLYEKQWQDQRIREGLCGFPNQGQDQFKQCTRLLIN